MSKTITDAELLDLKKKSREILSICRSRLLSKYPFIGSIALRMDIIHIRDVRVRTACTDGNAIYFDIAFLSSLSSDEQLFVYAHEVWHAVMMHLIRCGTRNPGIFNIAADKEVNAMLVKDGLIPPKDLLFPTEEEKDLCAEEIYELLIKNMTQNASNTFSSNTNNANSSNDNNSGNGNNDGKLSGQFDKHIYDNSAECDDVKALADSGITDQYGKVGVDSDFQPKISKDFAEKMRETIVSEVHRYEKMRGTAPSHLKDLVKKITSAEVPWQEVLSQFVTRCYNTGLKTWIPPNRRHVHNNLYLPRRQGERIKLACIIDTSGSTYDDRGKFLSELHSLIKSFGAFDLWIIECDAEVGSIKHYTQDDNLDQEIDNDEYAMTGGGGTAMLPGFQAVLDEQMEVDAILVLTDGYIDNIPTNPTDLPTLWVISKTGTEDFCDWGQKIRLRQ